MFDFASLKILTTVMNVAFTHDTDLIRERNSTTGGPDGHRGKHRSNTMIDSDHATCAFEAAKWALRMTFHEAGYGTADARAAAGIDTDALAAACAQEAKADVVGRAAGLAVSAAWRTIENITTQKAGRADALGITLDRAEEASGRYDGAF